MLLLYEPQVENVHLDDVRFKVKQLPLHTQAPLMHLIPVLLIFEGLQSESFTQETACLTVIAWSSLVRYMRNIVSCMIIRAQIIECIISKLFVYNPLPFAEAPQSIINILLAIPPSMLAVTRLQRNELNTITYMR